MKVMKGLRLKGESEGTTEEGSLETGGGGGGGLDRKFSFPMRTDVYSGDDGGVGGESRVRQSIGEVDGGILVSKEIEQEVEIREEGFDDQSTKDLIFRH